MNENKEMNEYVVLKIETYDNMQKNIQLLTSQYEKKEFALTLLKTEFDELLSIYLERAALTYLIKECENKDELTNPESNNFVMLKDDYCELLAMGIEKDAIIRKLKEVVANHG